MADAYKVKQDISLPRAVREVDELPDGTKVYETEGHNYGVGSYVLEEDISPDVLERLQESGKLDDFLESVGRDEAEAAMRAQAGYGTFVAQHSAEAFILDQYGHTVVPREQAVELAAAGSDAVSEAVEEAKQDDADKRNLPGLPEEEVDEEQVPAEMPPGIPVGEAAAEAKGAGKRKARTRPGGQQVQATGPTPPTAQQTPGTDPTSPHTGARARPRTEK